MDIEDLISTRNKVHYLEAQEVAVKLDMKKRQEAESTSSKGRF